MAANRTFPKSVRLTGHDAFGAVIRRGGCAADQILVVHALPHAGSGVRFGITIPKRTGNAVVRNRWKRHIREAIRHCRQQSVDGYDYVVRPKKDAVLNGQQIRRGLPKLLQRAVKRQLASLPQKN